MNRIILTAIFTMLVAGCATTEQERAATTGAVIGATAGAVIGAQSDRAAEGAVIGGVLGGLTGAILADDGRGRVYSSDRRYHRRACPSGQSYFDESRHTADLDRKIHLMKRGLRYCPNNPAAHNDLGVALMLKGNYRAAEQHFRHALRLDPGYEPARRNLAHVHRLMGRHGYKAHKQKKHDRYEYDHGYKKHDAHHGKKRHKAKHDRHEEDDYYDESDD